MANNQKIQRYILYWSSQLMYGLAKILKYQTDILIGEAYNSSPHERNEADEENWPHDIDLPNDLSSPPRTEGIRKNLIIDFHLMPDIDMSRLNLNQEVAQFTSPSFGELSSEPLHFFLRNDDWSKDMIVDMTSVNFDQPVRLGDRSNEDQSDELAHVELQDELPPFTEEFTEQRRSTRMSNKRIMPEPNLDTPPKRKRRSIIQPDITPRSDMEVSPKGKDDQIPEQVAIDPVDVPASPGKSAKSPEKNIETMFGEFLLDPLISPEKQKRSKKKKNVKLIDEFTKIHGSVFDKTNEETIQYAVSPQITDDETHAPIMEIDIQDVPNESIHLHDTCSRTTVSREDASDKMPAGSKSKTSIDRSHLSSEDLDAFLPPKAKVSKIEISREPSISSRESSFPNPWSKFKLIIHMSLLRDNCSHGCQVLKFSDIVSPDSASELEAVTCFSLLLEMHREGLIKLIQRDHYDVIFIYPASVL